MRFLQRLRLSPLSPGFVTFLVLVLSGLGHPVTARRRGPDRGPRTILRAERSTAPRRTLLFLPRGQEAEGRIAAGLARVDPQGGRFGPGGRARQARREPDGRGHPLRRTRDAADRSVRRSRLTSSRDGFTWGTVAVAGSHGDGSAPSPSRSVLTSGSPRWSLQPLRRPPVPDITSGGFGGWSDWCRTRSIDLSSTACLITV